MQNDFRTPLFFLHSSGRMYEHDEDDSEDEGGGAIQLAFYQILFINYLHSIAKGTCVSIFTFHDIFHYKKSIFKESLWAGYAQVTRHLSF